MADPSSHPEHPHLRLIRDYFDAIEQDVPEPELARFYSPEIQQREFPNRVSPTGALRAKRELLEGRHKGRAVSKDERYTIHNALVQGDQVAVELTWSAEVKIPLGTLNPGDTLRAHCAVFFRIKAGQIVEQHNFDCFEPF
jgi:ketosteroid isomerase-like protein